MIQVRIAVGAALLGAAASANAYDISNFNASTAVVVNVSGSTAIDNTLVNETLVAASGGMCDTSNAASSAATGNGPGTVDEYDVKDANGTITNRFMFCTASANSGITAGTQLVIVKESNGGSGNGIHPVANGTTLAFLDPGLVKTAAGAADANCTNSVQAASTSGQLVKYTLHDGCTGSLTLAKVPSGGVADVEGPLLAPAATKGELNAVVGKPGLAVVWGVPVTKSLYYALQDAEGLGAGGTAPCNVANNDDPACTPSLSKAQVTSVYNGLLTDWSQLKLPNGTQLTSHPVYLCRRDNGSGTEASFEYEYLGARCGSSDLVMADETGLNVGFVFINTSTGSVRTCLQAAQAGTALVPYTSANGNVANMSAGSWAVGILSTEVKLGDLYPHAHGSDANANKDDAFRFVAVNGAAPTLENTVDGRWGHFSEDVFYYNKSSSGNALNAFKATQALAAKPALIAESNSSFSHAAGLPWGDGGDLTPATSSFATTAPTVPATPASVASYPVNSLSKSLNATGSPNNCDQPQAPGNFFTLTTGR